jgi:glycogen synthase
MVTERYSWASVAAQTVDVYRAALREATSFDARQAEAMLANRPTIVVPEGNLLAMEGALS